MGSVFYRGIDPSHMGYADLRYYDRWSKTISDEELAAVDRARAGG